MVIKVLLDARDNMCARHVEPCSPRAWATGGSSATGSTGCSEAQGMGIKTGPRGWELVKGGNLEEELAGRSSQKLCSWPKGAQETSHNLVGLRNAGQFGAA